MPVFERRDCCAHCRLGQIERFGGSRNVLPLGDRNKDPKLLKRHTHHHTTIPRRRTPLAGTAHGLPFRRCGGEATSLPLRRARCRPTARIGSPMMVTDPKRVGALRVLWPDQRVSLMSARESVAM